MNSQRKQGNLTGIPRKIKDSCIEIYNCVQRWNSLISDGTPTVKQISKIKLDALSSENDTIQSLYPDQLKDSIITLENIVMNLALVFNKMKSISSKMKSICDLEEFEAVSLHGDVFKLTPVFHTWDCKQFWQVMSEICEMYDKELRVKKAVFENICHQEDQNDLMFHVSSWIYQSYVKESSKVFLQSMLIETGTQ